MIFIVEYIVRHLNILTIEKNFKIEYFDAEFFL